MALVSEVNALSTLFITDVNAFTVLDVALKIKAAPEIKTFCIVLNTARMVLATAKIIFVKNVMIDDTVLTKNVLMAFITIRKNFLIERAVETTKFLAAIIREVKNFLIEVMTFKIKVAIETKMAIKPFLMERRNFLIALTVFTKKIVMAWAKARIALCNEFTTATMKLTKPVIIEIAKFLIEEASLEIKAAIEVKMAIKPFLMASKNFLIA